MGTRHAAPDHGLHAQEVARETPTPVTTIDSAVRTGGGGGGRRLRSTHQAGHIVRSLHFVGASRHARGGRRSDGRSIAGRRSHRQALVGRRCRLRRHRGQQQCARGRGQQAGARTQQEPRRARLRAAHGGRSRQGRRGTACASGRRVGRQLRGADAQAQGPVEQAARTPGSGLRQGVRHADRRGCAPGDGQPVPEGRRRRGRQSDQGVRAGEVAGLARAPADGANTGAARWLRGARSEASAERRRGDGQAGEAAGGGPTIRGAAIRGATSACPAINRRAA